ncbi:class I SAM-dependent methyltransferase [candidate division TA06 bacterium]|nr:class I SAM-dependent methyltransferase [candidate division TA06 bacterium]
MENKTSFGPQYYRRYSGNLFQTIWGSKPGALKVMKKIAGSGKLLDVGCGIGRFLNEASARYDAFGTEISEYALMSARHQACLKGRLTQADALKGLPYRSGSFDVVTALDIVEHLEHPELFIAEAWRLLRPGGLLVISTPNPDSLGRAIKKEQWFGYRDKTHVSIQPEEFWLRLVSREGRLKKIFYDGLWDSPYFLRNGFWALPVVRGLVGLAQSLTIVLPFIVMNHLGLGSSRRLGENLWLFACKKHEER